MTCVWNDNLREEARASPEEISDIEWQKIIADELTVMPRNADELCNALELPFYRVSKLCGYADVRNT